MRGGRRGSRPVLRKWSEMDEGGCEMGVGRGRRFNIDKIKKRDFFMMRCFLYHTAAEIMSRLPRERFLIFDFIASFSFTRVAALRSLIQEAVNVHSRC